MQVKNHLGGERLKAEVEFIESSINALPEDDYKIFLAVFVEKKSIRSVAEGVFMSHSGLRYRMENTIKAIAGVYESAFF